MLTIQRLKKIFQETSWTVKSDEIEHFTDGTEYINIENWSPAGEALPEYIKINDTEDDLVEQLRKLYEDFDPDEHAEMWVDHRGKNGVPSSIRELVEDADAIKAMLYRLYQDVKSIVERDAAKSQITYCGYSFDPDYIHTHICEFSDMLLVGCRPHTGFIQSCNLHDVLGVYCSQEIYNSAESVLLRIYDNLEVVDEILLKLKPGTIEAAQILRLKDEILGEDEV